jgi:hypothetical protein
VQVLVVGFLVLGLGFLVGLGSGLMAGVGFGQDWAHA